VAAISSAQRHREAVLPRGILASHFWKTAGRRLERMADQDSGGLARDSQTRARIAEHVCAVGAAKGPDILWNGLCEVRERKAAKRLGHVMRKHDTYAVQSSTAVSFTLGHAKYWAFHSGLIETLYVSRRLTYHCSDFFVPIVAP